MFTRNDRRHLMDWGALFCDVGDFCLEFEPQFRRRLLSDLARQRDRE